MIEHTRWDLRVCEDLQERVRQYEAPDPQSAICFGMVEESPACLAGTIGCHSVSRTHRGAELAYDLAPRDSGRGIATAVCAAVTGWSYAALGLQRVQATVLETNTRSERVLHNCGLSYEGLLRAYRLVRGVAGEFQDIRAARRRAERAGALIGLDVTRGQCYE